MKERRSVLLLLLVFLFIALIPLSSAKANSTVDKPITIVNAADVATLDPHKFKWYVHKVCWILDF